MSLHRDIIFMIVLSPPLFRNAVSLSLASRLICVSEKFYLRLRQQNLPSRRSSQFWRLYHPLYGKRHANLWCDRQDRHFFTVSKWKLNHSMTSSNHSWSWDNSILAASTSTSSASPTSNLTPTTISGGSDHLKNVVLPIVLTTLGVILIAICLGTWLRRRRLQLQRQLYLNDHPMEVSQPTFRHGTPSPGIHSFIAFFIGSIDVWILWRWQGLMTETDFFVDQYGFCDKFKFEALEMTSVSPSRIFLNPSVHFGRFPGIYPSTKQHRQLRGVTLRVPSVSTSCPWIKDINSG